MSAKKCKLVGFFVTFLAALLITFSTVALAQEKEYEVVVDKVMVPMRDGTKLATTVYRPDAEGKFPVVVVRDCYNAVNSRDVYQKGVLDNVSSGYVYVVQDTRGRYGSEGRWYTFIDDGWIENRDGFDTVQWAATQPWSDGKVGAAGSSYLGWTSYAVAPTQPPALVAGYASMTASSFYRNWCRRSGAFYHAWITRWVGTSYGPSTVEKSMTGPEKEAALNWVRLFAENMDNYYWYLPLNEFPPFKAVPDLKFYFDWLEHPDFDTYWARMDLTLQQHMFKVPYLHFGCWFDMFQQGTWDMFTGLQKNAATELARKSQKIIVGPWTHMGTYQYTAESGELVFPGSEKLPGMPTFNRMAGDQRWFDYWLKGKDNGVMAEPPILIYVMGDNVWRNENEWPLARTKYTNFYFHNTQQSGSIDSVNDGTLSTSLPGDARMDSFRYDPGDPVMTIGGHMLYPPDGPRDHQVADKRSLTYTSEVLTEDLEVTGPVKCVIYGMSTAVDTDWTVRLSDVYPDGKSFNMAEGILRARYRNSFSQPELLEPGKIYRFEIDMWNTSIVFKKGHRLRVAVHSSDFPKYSRNLNTAESPETGAVYVVADNFVACDQARPSHIVLPVIPR